MDQLETPRLRLRMFASNDLEYLSRIFSDPEVVKHLHPGHPLSGEETEAVLKSYIRHWRQNNYGRWAAVHKRTGKLIGYGGLRNAEGTPELVYLLARPYWGYGLATEMAVHCLWYGFERRRFKRIIAIARTGNLASRRVLGKIGMRHERNRIYFDFDAAFYGISRETFRLQRLSHLNVRLDAAWPHRSVM